MSHSLESVDQSKACRPRVWRIGLSLGLGMLAWSALGADRTVFRCESEGRITYSDTACARAARKEEIATDINTYTAEPVPSRTRTEKRTPANHDSIAATQQRNKERCAKLNDRLDAIQVKLRRGYTVEQGNRLHDQRRQLEAERRREKC